MFRHSTNTASFFSVFITTLIFSLSLAGVAAAQEGNTRLGTGALQNNTTGDFNTAIGGNALFSNTTGDNNTASGVGALSSNTTGDLNTASGVNALAANTTGFQNTASGFNALLNNTEGTANTASGFNALVSNTTGSFNTASGRQALVNNTTGLANTGIGLNALFSNTTGNFNTAIGNGANVSTGDLTNATAIGNGATVDASNKIRLGSTAVTVIEGQVAFTASSDKTQKENFKPVDGEEVLGKIRWLELSSWNFIGHDPKEFRHYGPMAQDFFAAFGYDGLGQIGTETTINSGDIAGILMIAVQALEKRTAELKQKEAQMAVLESRLEALELRQNHPMQITAGKNLSSVTTGE
jgi:trimeric autotransporter adhesin